MNTEQKRDKAIKETMRDAYNVLLTTEEAEESIISICKEYANEKCKEQRELCCKEFKHLGTYHGTVVWDKIKKSPEPDFG